MNFHSSFPVVSVNKDPSSRCQRAPSPPAPLTAEKWSVKVRSCWFVSGIISLQLNSMFKTGFQCLMLQDGEVQVCSDKQAACRQLETSGIAESSH